MLWRFIGHRGTRLSIRPLKQIKLNSIMSMDSHLGCVRLADRNGTVALKGGTGGTWSALGHGPVRRPSNNKVISRHR